MLSMKQKTLTFGDLLFDYMNGMSAYALSKKSGVPQQTISRFLRGESNNPSLENMLKIARALNVSLAVFDNVTLPDSKG